MSIDLDWTQLDEDLCKKTLDGINEALKTSIKKPAFLGDIVATSFSFGKISPQLEIVEIRDVFDEFLHVENEDSEEEIEESDYDEYDDENDTQYRRDEVYGQNNTLQQDTRLSTSPTTSLSGSGRSGGTMFNRPLTTPGLLTPNASLWLHHQSLASSASSSNGPAAAPGVGRSASSFSSTMTTPGGAMGYPFPPSILQRNHSMGSMSINTAKNINNNKNDDNGSRRPQDKFGRSYLDSTQMYPSRSPQGQRALGEREDRSRRSNRQGSPFTQDTNFTHDDDEDDHENPDNDSAQGGRRRRNASPFQQQSSDPTAGISLQLHFRIKYLGNMSISLNTILKVNYPSLSFMSLPLNLRITGLAFEGLLVVAFEGDKKRLHVSILNEDDKLRNRVVKGEDLIRNALVESEVGQADKLVLKDVAKVEEFVLEMARKAIQDEIAWPNFQSFAWT